MAGSIFKKLRGLFAKFWAKLQIFLKREGLRVHFQERRGLFSKCDRPKGYGWISAVGSGSDGPDLIGLGSNHGRPSRIGWPGLRWGDGGGAGRRETFPAAALRRRGPKPVFPWPICLGFGPGMITSTRVVHLGLLLGSVRDPAGFAMAPGGASSPAGGVPVLPGATGLNTQRN